MFEKLLKVLFIPCFINFVMEPQYMYYLKTSVWNAVNWGEVLVMQNALWYSSC